MSHGMSEKEARKRGIHQVLRDGIIQMNEEGVRFTSKKGLIGRIAEKKAKWYNPLTWYRLITHGAGASEYHTEVLHPKIESNPNIEIARQLIAEYNQKFPEEPITLANELSKAKNSFPKTEFEKARGKIPKDYVPDSLTRRQKKIMRKQKRHRLP